jgi:nitrogen fixation protein FixH
LGIVSSSYEERRSQQAGKRRWFHWGPAIIIIFFLALFALDGVLVTVSTQGLPPKVAEALLPKNYRNEHVRSVFPGIIANDFQKKEALYNEYLEQVKRQDERGWKIDKGWLKKPLEDDPAVFQVRVLESDDAPVQSAEVSGVFLRPSDSREDTAFDMREIEPGLYQAVVSLPEPGLWDLLLTVKKGGQLHELRASTSVDARAH